MTQVVNADGSVTVNTAPLTIVGDGQNGGWGMSNNATIPIGGTASISFIGTSANGASTFQASWIGNNFGQ